jgi:hypothetical protein
VGRFAQFVQIVGNELLLVAIMITRELNLEMEFDTILREHITDVVNSFVHQFVDMILSLQMK